MGLLEAIRDERTRRVRNAWPVGPGVVTPSDRYGGHDDSQFSPAEYGNYLATSNDVYAAAQLRARLMSSVRLRCFDGDSSSKREVDSSAPEVALLRRVNPFWTGTRLARMDELCMSIWGESYWAVEKDRRGVPAEIWWLKPSRVKPIPHETSYLGGFLYEPANGGAPLRFAPDEIVWHRYPNPLDEFSALSPLAAARLAADAGSAMMQANRNLFTQGLTAGGVVVPATDKVSFSDQQAKDLEHAIDRRMTGVERRHKWAVLRYEAKFQAMNVTPKDAEFVQGLNLTLRMVANAYGIPVPLLNDLANATLANAKEYQKILWTHALVPDLAMRASELEEQYLPMFPRRQTSHIAPDFSAVAALQDAQTEQWGRDVEAIRVGAQTINEWRERNGLPPVPWGDVWWAPVNQSAVTDEHSAPQGDTTPTRLASPVDPAAARLLAALRP